MERRLVPVKLDTQRPLRDIVFENLREAIKTGVLKPGERLMEIQLAEELGVSRTPVREAIRKLEQEEFIVMVPRKGAYVASVSVKDITDVFEVRAALEALAAGLAAQRVTDAELDTMERLLVRHSSSTEDENLGSMVVGDIDFHDLVYRASRNRRLMTIINNLREQLQRFRTTSLGHPGRMKEALDEHRKMVEAISDRNVELAQTLAWEHIENAEDRLLEAMGVVKKSRQDGG
ncbi:MAG: GntR family transcriptional regulator [Heliobacteriaceae bacterium]|nr:GntR family transcriptional regulator [Heliobacteriaceae bacterium]MDD4587631.1 GntR family transcriptional regulator [Heliobacteriaceae bacterium]